MKNIIFLLPFVFYIAGSSFIPSESIEELKKRGIAEQEEYYYYDGNGDEYADETLITIRGIGKILTYKDIYLASIPLFVFSIIISEVIFQKYDIIEIMILSNCVLGFLLICLTTKGTVLSTILFWLGIISAGIVGKKPSQ